MKNRAVVFALAFGDPKPMHKLIMDNWSLQVEIDFVLLTDRTEEWKSMVESNSVNIIVHKISVLELFEKAASYLGYGSAADFMARHGEKYYGRVDGWSACGFRPILHILFNEYVGGAKWHGWIDWDVMLNPFAIKVLLNKTDDVLLMAEKFLVWEHFQIFSKKVDLCGLYVDLLKKDMDKLSPMESRLCYTIRNDIGDYKKADFKQECIAPHWGWSDIHFPEKLANQCNIVYENNGKMVSETGNEILFFIADTQVKLFSADMVNQIDKQLKENGCCIYEYNKMIDYKI